MGLYCLSLFVGLSVFTYKVTHIYVTLPVCTLASSATSSARLLLPATSSDRDVIEISFLSI